MYVKNAVYLATRIVAQSDNIPTLFTLPFCAPPFLTRTRTSLSFSSCFLYLTSGTLSFVSFLFLILLYIHSFFSIYLFFYFRYVYIFCTKISAVHSPLEGARPLPEKGREEKRLWEWEKREALRERRAWSKTEIDGRVREKLRVARLPRSNNHQPYISRSANLPPLLFFAVSSSSSSSSLPTLVLYTRFYLFFQSLLADIFLPFFVPISGKLAMWNFHRNGTWEKSSFFLLFLILDYAIANDFCFATKFSS